MWVTPRAVAVAVAAAAAIAVVAVEVVAEAMQAVTGVDQALSGVVQSVFKQQQVRTMAVQQRRKPRGTRPRNIARSATSTGTGILHVQARPAPPIGGTDNQRMFAYQGKKMPFSPTSTPISIQKSFVEFDALVAETGETSQMSDTAGEQVVSFVADSGASRHDFPSSAYMFNYVECDRTVSTATGDSFPIEGYGDVRVELLSAGRAVRGVMENVAHVPTFKHNPLSVGTAAGQEHSMVFDEDACTTAQIRNIGMLPKIREPVLYPSLPVAAARTCLYRHRSRAYAYHVAC